MATSKPPLIIGSGIAGLTSSIALLKHPLYSTLYHSPPTILEKSPLFTPNLGAGISLAPNSIPFLKKLGVFTSIANDSCALKTVEIWSERTRSKLGEMKGEMYTGRWNEPLMTTERGLLQQHLLNYAKQLGVDIKYNSEITSIQDSNLGVKVTLANGETIDAPMIIAADGARSIIRSLIYQTEGSPEPPLDTAGLVCVYGLSNSIPSIPQSHTQWVMGEGEQYGTWALPDNKCFWYINQYEPDRVRNGNIHFTQEEVDATVEKYKERWFPYVTSGKFKDVIKDSRRIIKVGLFSKRFDKVYGFNGKVVLVGDAAHPMVPFAGQGANTGIEDVSVLVSLLFSGKDTLEIAKEYAKQRLPRTKQIVDFANSSGMIMMGKGMLRPIRDLSFKVPSGLLGMSMDWLYKVDY